MRIKNSKGTVYYGMHFYPGVAEYQDEPHKDPYRVFINEDTIRSMDDSFQGRPVFVHHVDEVAESVDDVKRDADGWVIQSFYNQADGKHWVKFIVVSEAGEAAIRQGMRLSNCYRPKAFAGGGLWNGVQYSKEIKGAEYEHLAIVPNPRYDESVILTPEQFKAYNEGKNQELQRLANAKHKKGQPMFFKREKVDNSDSIANMEVHLPKCKRTLTIKALVNEMDDLASKPTAVEVDGKAMTIDELLTAYKAAMARIEELEGSEDEYEDDGEIENAEDDEEKKENEDDGEIENAEDDEDDKEKAPPKKDDKAPPAKKKANAAQPVKNAAERAKAKEKADRLRNAARDAEESEAVRIDLSSDKIARGNRNYGSGR